VEATGNDCDLSTLRAIMERRGRFGHSEHLELAWGFLVSYSFEEAAGRTVSAIRHVATLHGASDRYHDTITRAWVRLVAVHMSRGHADSFDEFIAENGGLLDRDLLERHYSSETLWSDAARQRWTEPNVRRFPTLV
jgi:hypothetical protein